MALRHQLLGFAAALAAGLSPEALAGIGSTPQPGAPLSVQGATSASSAEAIGASAAAAAKTPTAAQIRAAIRRAEKSPDLWATIHICNIPSKHPKGNKLVGVRVQMPGLGFTSRLYMAVRIEYFSTAKKRYLNTDSHLDLKTFGLAIRVPHQGGVVFPFASPARGVHFVLRGVATLEWRIGPKLLGRVVRTTGRGYKHVDLSIPRGYSAATCKITA